MTNTKRLYLHLAIWSLVHNQLHANHPNFVVIMCFCRESSLVLKNCNPNFNACVLFFSPSASLMLCPTMIFSVFSSAWKCRIKHITHVTLRSQGHSCFCFQYFVFFTSQYLVYWWLYVKINTFYYSFRKLKFIKVWFDKLVCEFMHESEIWYFIFYAVACDYYRTTFVHTIYS